MSDPTREAIIKWLEQMRTSREVHPNDNKMATDTMGYIRLLEFIAEKGDIQP